MSYNVIPTNKFIKEAKRLIRKYQVPIVEDPKWGKFVLLIQVSFMSKDELRSEINKVLNNFSDKALEELYSFLMKLQSANPTAFSNSKDLQKILSEDKKLLEKLDK